jgi:hypothetical protein
MRVIKGDVTTAIHDKKRIRAGSENCFTLTRTVIRGNGRLFVVKEVFQMVNLRIWGEVETARALRLLKTVIIVSAFCTALVSAANAQTFTIGATFDGSNGSSPNSLVQGLDGDLWGTTGLGGTKSCGTVFTMTPTGTLSDAFSFNCKKLSHGRGQSIQL